MNAEYINPFIQASNKILKEVVNINTSIGEVYIKPSPYASGSLAIIIGLAGDIRGQVIMSMNEGVGKDIASTMMGAQIEQLDELSKSAITEVANMILGNTATIFSEKGIDVSITPPSLLTGDNMAISTPKTRVICVPLEIESGGKIELDVALVQ
ncbi:MAG: chemotaxis protein CheX [Clostridiales bacterium]|nr:chemotaxis protein CheX [Clostridiales bacterium]